MSLRFEESNLMKEKSAIENKDASKRTKKEQERLKEINSLLKKKIISVTMSQALVSLIDELVHDRVGRSRAQLIEDAVRWYLDYSVHRWNERGVYVSGFRVAFESETMSSLFFSKLTPSDQYDLGLTAGSQSAIADVIKLFHGSDATNEESRSDVLGLLQDYGWGSITTHDDNLIVVSSPFYPAPFIQGYLESLLEVKLDLVETAVKDTVALRVK
ncbi:MAG: ribbon-helix-helix domain-containing protein [Candidatus Thorarchaeota archaeon]